MVYFSKQDFQLAAIPFKQRECYLFDLKGDTYVCFDPKYIYDHVHILKNIRQKRLEDSNYLYVPFKNKMLVSIVQKIFKLTKPTKNKKATNKGKDYVI